MKQEAHNSVFLKNVNTVNSSKSTDSASYALTECKHPTLTETICG